MVHHMHPIHGVMITVLIVSLCLLLGLSFQNILVRDGTLRPMHTNHQKDDFRSKLMGRQIEISNRLTCPILLPQNDTSGLLSYKRNMNKRLRQSKLSRHTYSNITNKAQVSNRIIGGVSLNSSLLPYLALLSFTDTSTPLCTGTVVGPRMIITAAHCITLIYPSASSANISNPSIISVYLNATESYFPEAILHTISHAYAHPLFNAKDPNSFLYDIAYLILSENVSSSSKYMKVNSNSQLPAEWSVVRNLGYGLQSYKANPNDYNENDVITNDKVKQLDIPTTSFAYCNSEWSRQDEVPTNLINSKYQICAGYYNGGCSSCYGDSGGPIMQYDNDGIPVLMGVASIAFQCGTRSVPTVYVRVSAFISNFLPEDSLLLSNSVESIISKEEDRSGPRTSQTQLVIIIAIAVAVFIVIILIVVCVVIVVRRAAKKRKQSAQDPVQAIEPQVPPAVVYTAHNQQPAYIPPPPPPNS